MTQKLKARYIMIGGFLGAGKTTAVAKLAQHLTEQGLKVGLITNDQGRELVDTTMLRAKGFATEEIPGGCFCCRFNSLVDAADRLTVASRPDVFVAEPVGSCTDLVATVTYPLRRMYGEQFSIAPVSVLVDPVRVGRVLGLASGGSFSEKVTYIYRKQLEEADLIVINKVDLLAASELDRLQQALTTQYPKAEVLAVSARNATNLEHWFSRLENAEQTNTPTMEVDYDVYAEGEALLGWYNATIFLTSAEPFDADRVITDFALEIQSRLKSAGAEIAHLKMTFSPSDSLAGEIAAINVVRNDVVPELSLKLPDPVSSGQLIVNLRAENAPDSLAAIVRDSLPALKRAAPSLNPQIEHLEHFRPGRPTPTHRDVR